MSLHSDDHLSDRPRQDLEEDRDATLVAHREEVIVRTERVARGRVVLRKRVVEEEQTITVTVRREELEVLEEDAAGQGGGAAVGGGALGRDADRDLGQSEGAVSDADTLGAEDAPGADDVEVVLYAERPVVSMEVVPVERVVVRRSVLTEEKTVTTDVSREEIVVEGDTLDTLDTPDR